MHRTSPQAEACIEEIQLKDECMLELKNERREEKQCGNSEVTMKTKEEKLEQGDE